jgi:diaminobutyrate-2-oxoglutarate transaminase
MIIANPKPSLSQSSSLALSAQTLQNSQPLPSSTLLTLIGDTESAVRTYCRSTPVVFTRAQGSYIYDEDDRQYIDFLSAAGSLNYGHNDPHIKQSLLQYLQDDGILQSLDFATEAKAVFLQKFRDTILMPRGLSYRVQFTGPTGANCVEAALKLARKVTGRRAVAAFTNGYHGVSLGALALTGNRSKRQAAGVSLDDTLRLPFDGYFGSEIDTLDQARKLFLDASSGYDLPAAFIVETVQGEGGLNCASGRWMRALAALAKELGALLIVDDIQAGCGRCGTFFSFESMDIRPDIVCLSKSIGGAGLPMALTLIRPELDVWEPGEHNGTFRGNNLAFVGAAAALDYWRDASFQKDVAHRATLLEGSLRRVTEGCLKGRATAAGRGLFVGLRFTDSQTAERLRSLMLSKYVLTETCGPNDEVVKFLPAINIPEKLLRQGLAAMEGCAEELMSQGA